MNQTKLLWIILVLTFVIGVCVFVVFISSEDVAFAEDDSYSIKKETCAVEELQLGEKTKSVVSIVNECKYNVDAEITTIKLKYNKTDTISNIKFFKPKNDYAYVILKDNYFNIEIRRAYKYEFLELSYSLITQNGKMVDETLFLFENEQGVFFSNNSLIDSKRQWFSYVTMNDYITIETAKTIQELIDNDNEKSNIELFKYSNNIYKQSQSTRGSKDTFVSGKVKWTTRNNSIVPIRQVLVEVYDRNSDIFGDDCLGSTITNSYGNYSITFQNNDSAFDNGGSDIYIKIYAGDGNIEVRGSFPSVDHQESRYSVNTRDRAINDVKTGLSYTIDETITMIDEDDVFRERACQAIQISQALVVARSYASEQMGYQPSSVDVWYPWNSAGCYYEAFTHSIYIPYLKGDNSSYYSYESWDVIMHEYGHHIQYQIGLKNIWSDIQSYIENGNTSAHSSLTNDAERYGKSVGIKLAWAESWPTIFGLIAQKEYVYYIANIDTVRDSSYTAYNDLNYDLETSSIRLGEACERSIMAVLWDLYDSQNETNDKITLSASDWWDLTTISGTYTFFDFIQNFYSTHPEYIDDVGQNLSYYKMCAADLSIDLGASPTACPNISWTNYSGWTGHPLTTAVIAYDETETLSCILGLSVSNTISGLLDQSQWNHILAWEGATFKVKMYSAQGDAPETGNYISKTYIFAKPQFSVIEKQDGTYEITGTYCRLSDSISIPAEYLGKNVTSISDYAFSGQVGITSVDIPTSITSIGSYAFYNCTNLTSVYYMTAAHVTSVADYTFYNCPISRLYWQNNIITSIGSYAFYGNHLSTIDISSTTTYVGDNAFGNSSNLTIYSAADDTHWASTWNSANRPYFKNCVFSSGGGYLVSFNKTDTNPGNSYSGTINKPTRNEYTFDVWYVNSDFTGDYYTMANINSAPNGMLYVKWYKPSSGGSCITTGSLITLADGTQTAVENLTGNEQLLVWDMLNGTFTSAPILFIDTDPTTTYEVITLTFSDGTTVNLIDEHAFFDTTLNKYVFLRSDASQYIGHYFTKQILDGNNNMIQTTVQLVEVSIEEQITTAYSPVTYGHLCYYVNGMLSMPGNTESFINIFDVNPTTMAYDETAMVQDIATYGLYTYEEFSNIIPIPQLVFDAFNGQYLKVAIGKGITTLEEIQALLDRYSVFFE